MLWGRVTYEMMESYWPAVARGDEEAPPAMREWAVKLEAKPKYVVSSTRKDFPWTNSHHIAGDLRTGVQKLKDATPAGVLLGSGKLATELDRPDLIDEYKFLVHPRIAGHGPTLYQSGLPRAFPIYPRVCLSGMMPPGRNDPSAPNPLRREVPHGHGDESSFLVHRRILRLQLRPARLLIGGAARLDEPRWRGGRRQRARHGRPT